jgi:Flp pilus assembly protein TadD
LLVGLGRADEAVDHLRRSAVLAPGVPEIQYHLGYALAKAGKADEARVALEGLLRSHSAFPSRSAAEELLEAL